MDVAQGKYFGQGLEHGFRIEGLVIEPLTGEISGPGGREKLDPKVMGVLLLMAERAGHVVSRDDLHEQLWPNAVVTDDAITRCFYELRRHLSRAAGDQRYRALIETLPKRGYRLNGAIAPPDKPAIPAAPPRVRPGWLIVAVMPVIALIVFAIWRGDIEPAAPAPGVAHSVAVLPFVDMSETHDQGYFADGVAEEILNRLTKSNDLRVIARTSSFSFRGANIGIPEIAAELGVNHVLEGSVRRSGDQIRITAQLIAAADGSHLWSASYERESGELFAVQDEIADAVATALETTLTGRDARAGTPPDPKAYEHFLQGRFYFDRRAPGDIERAAGYYRDAIAVDPQFARAWAALAGAYNLLSYQQDADLDRLLPLQREAAQRAVELAPALAVAHARLAQYYYNVSDPENGNRHFRTAQALDPRDPLVMGFAADRALRQGDIEGVVETWRKLVELDPLSATDRGNYGAYLVVAGQYDEAERQIRKSLELSPDLHWHVHLDLARIHVLKGDHDAAYAEVMQMPEGEPRDYGLGMLYAAAGHAAEADAALHRLAANATYTDDVYFAELYAMRGRNDEAFAALSAMRARIERAGAGKPQVRSRIVDLQMDMRRSVLLRPLHSDPRWQQLMVPPQRVEYEGA